MAPGNPEGTCRHDGQRAAERGRWAGRSALLIIEKRSLSKALSWCTRQSVSRHHDRIRFLIVVVGVAVAQVTLRAPADILGSVSLRGEEDGWFGRAASAALTAVLAAGGWPAPFPDEFFFQVTSTTCSPHDRLSLQVASHTAHAATQFAL